RRTLQLTRRFPVGDAHPPRQGSRHGPSGWAAGGVPEEIAIGVIARPQGLTAGLTLPSFAIANPAAASFGDGGQRLSIQVVLFAIGVPEVAVLRALARQLRLHEAEDPRGAVAAAEPVGS